MTLFKDICEKTCARRQNAPPVESLSFRETGQKKPRLLQLLGRRKNSCLL